MLQPRPRRAILAQPTIALRVATAIALLALVLVAPTAGLVAASAAGRPSSPTSVSHDDHAHAHDAGSGIPRTKAAALKRGRVLDGLTPAAFGPCKGGFRVDVRGGGKVCTHGPDLAPVGVDVTEKRSVRSLRREARSAPVNAADSSGPDGVPCVGDGVTGKRIQAVYAVASDKTDRFANIAPLIRIYAGHMDAWVAQSAAQTGGERHLRFVTKPDCSLDVAHVVLSPSGDDTFGNTINELRAQGYTNAGRKYHVWVDANVYCGIGQIWSDDSASGNANDSSVSYARSDNGCWDYAELHEVFHGLGAVQMSAPHQSGGWHCTDEYDLMCYADAAGVVLTYPCPASNAMLLDCGHNDYFDTSPGANSYLGTHWNTADSSFLSHASLDGGPGPTPTPTPTPTPAPTVTKTWNGTTSSKPTTKSWDLSVGAGATRSTLTFTSASPSATLRLRILTSTGTIKAEATGPSPLVLDVTLPKGRFKWQVYGNVATSFQLKVTYVKP